MAYRSLEMNPIMDTAYRSPSFADSQASTFTYGEREQESDTDPLKGRRWSTEQHEAPAQVSGPKTIVIQLFALAWIAPALTLLVLNVKTHILGASAWCPFDRCYPQVFNEDTNLPKALPAKFDRETHNFLGALQLVAKALEIWFILICTWLVYLVTIKLAQKREGLPIGYLSRPSEFAEIPSLFDRLLWTTLRHSAVRRRYPSAKGRLWIFIISTVILCVLCNLMGPAVAVLVIPSLQWIDTQDIVTDRFISFNSGSPPTTDGFAFRDSLCTPQNFTDMQYGCSWLWANSLDSWTEATFARQGRRTAVASLQDWVSFSYNQTWVATSNATFPNGTYQTNRTYDTINWAPSRQMIQELSDDLRIVQNVSRGLDVIDPRGKNSGDTYALYNNTVQTLLQRSGPILGALVNNWVGFNNSENQASHFSVELDDTRSVRCYENYNLLNTPNCWGDCVSAAYRSYTRCITMGSGWNDGYKQAGFTVDGRYNHINDKEYMGPDANFWHIASGHAAFLPNGTIPQNVLDAGFSPDCLKSSTVNRTSCNWDAFFNLTAEDPWIKPRSKKVNTLQIWWDMEDVPHKPSLITLVIDFVAFQSFADYVLDTSWISNAWFQVDSRTPTMPDHQLYELNPIEVDPAWTLAAWSVNTGWKLDGTRSAPARLQKLNDRFYGTDDSTWQDYNLYAERNWLNSIALMPIMQTLSLIDYTTTGATTGEDDSNPAQPLIRRNARISVWAYGISSRTGYLGIVVVSCGCLVVLTEFLLGLKDRRRFRSPTQLLVAALEHTNVGEFNGLHADRDISRVSFRLENDHLAAGRFRFEKS